MSNGLVALKSASLTLGGGSGTPLYSGLNVWVKVKNIAHVKDVQMRYRGQFSSIWKDARLTWKDAYGSYDLFALEPALDFGSTPFVEFAIEYAAGGETSWDNNYFANYSLSPYASALTTGINVMLSSANLVFGGTPGSSYVTGIQGEIFVNNLSYEKKVGIRHSSDGWISYLDIDGIYNRSLGGSLESWIFGRDTSPSGFDRGEFAVYYLNRETGRYYWDNNFGQNYDTRYRYNLQ
jgi:hypothetical protein